jgi:hypothetical protein
MKEPRKIYVDGQLIGEVPTTDDNQKDMEAAIALMREKGVYRETTREQAIFGQAVAFATTSAYLHKRDLAAVPRNGVIVVPFVVNAAFALELYLKTLALLHGDDLRGHDLLELFDALPTAAHQALLSNFAKSKWPFGITELVVFRAEIERLRHSFVEWRYLHEKSRAGEIRFGELIFVMEVLHETCRADTRLNAQGAMATD